MGKTISERKDDTSVTYTEKEAEPPRKMKEIRHHYVHGARNSNNNIKMNMNQIIKVNMKLSMNMNMKKSIDVNSKLNTNTKMNLDINMVTNR
jgi:predicted FMN-binding regulatory protein PaiB